MRLFPAVPFSSKISESRALDVRGVTIPAKTNVMWMKTAVGLNEEIFANARRFDPSRFAAGPDGARPAASIASAMAFGAGARHCIGHHLAEHLCSRFLGAVLREFDLVSVHDVAVTYSATVSVTPSSVPVRLVPRARSRRTQSGRPPRGDESGALCPVRIASCERKRARTTVNPLFRSWGRRRRQRLSGENVP
jgi:hypothetical protein